MVGGVSLPERGVRVAEVNAFNMCYGVRASLKLFTAFHPC